MLKGVMVMFVGLSKKFGVCGYTFYRFKCRKQKKTKKVCQITLFHTSVKVGFCKCYVRSIYVLCPGGKKNYILLLHLHLLQSHSVFLLKDRFKVFICDWLIFIFRKKVLSKLLICIRLISRQVNIS